MSPTPGRPAPGAAPTGGRLAARAWDAIAPPGADGEELAATIAAIPSPREDWRQAALRHLDQLTKPPGSLGRLEELAARLAALRQTPRVSRKALVLFAADHGVARRGVSAYPPEVTAQMVRNFLAGGAAANVLARQAGARVVVVDVGVAGDLEPHPDLLAAKVRPGTRDLCGEDAMTEGECLRALVTGIRVAGRLAAEGVDCLLAGEMGIGNTTPATALCAAVFGLDPGELVGRGTGVDDAGLARKLDAIRMALARHAGQGAGRGPLATLASLGGLEIAACAGLCLGAAARRVPLIVDGFIATAAAAIAERLAPSVRPWLFFAHRSAERGHARVLAAMEVEPLLDLGLRLGEGTGALLAAHLLEGACRIFAEMATFASAGVAGRAE